MSLKCQDLFFEVEKLRMLRSLYNKIEDNFIRGILQQLIEINKLGSMGYRVYVQLLSSRSSDYPCCSVSSSSQVSRGFEKEYDPITYGFLLVL